MLSRLRRWAGLSLASAEEPDAEPSPPKPTPVEVMDENFAAIVLEADRLAVVDFWADWCQPCTVMSAYMEFLLDEFGDRVLVASLDVDENQDIAAQYEIMGLPTLLMFRNGDEIARQVGLLEYQALRQKVEQLLSTPSSNP